MRFFHIEFRFCGTPLVTDQVWILQLLHHLYIIEFDIEILVHRLQGPADLYIVLELDCYFVIDQGFEKAV